MRPEFKFNYEGSVNAPCGKSLAEKKRLAESCVRIACGSDVETIVIDPEKMPERAAWLEKYRNQLENSGNRKKERKQNAE